MAFLNVMADESRSTSAQGVVRRGVHLHPRAAEARARATWSARRRTSSVEDGASKRDATNSPSQPRMRSSNIGGSLGHVCRMRSKRRTPASHAASTSASAGNRPLISSMTRPCANAQAARAPATEPIACASGAAARYLESHGKPLPRERPIGHQPVDVGMRTRVVAVGGAQRRDLRPRLRAPAPPRTLRSTPRSPARSVRARATPCPGSACRATAPSSPGRRRAGAS